MSCFVCTILRQLIFFPLQCSSNQRTRKRPPDSKVIPSFMLFTAPIDSCPLHCSFSKSGNGIRIVPKKPKVAGNPHNIGKTFGCRLPQLISGKLAPCILPFIKNDHKLTLICWQVREETRVHRLMLLIVSVQWSPASDMCVDDVLLICCTIMRRSSLSLLFTTFLRIRCQ